MAAVEDPITVRMFLYISPMIYFQHDCRVATCDQWYLVTILEKKEVITHA